jgi:hypothetical protein
MSAAVADRGLANRTSPEAAAYLLAAFRKGLSEIGFVEGRTAPPARSSFTFSGSHFSQCPSQEHQFRDALLCSCVHDLTGNFPTLVREHHLMPAQVQWVLAHRNEPIPRPTTPGPVPQVE